MSSSLDKLKALTSRLDDRLAQKRQESPTKPFVDSEPKSVKEVTNLINAEEKNEFDRDISTPSNIFGTLQSSVTESFDQERENTNKKPLFLTDESCEQSVKKINIFEQEEDDEQEKKQKIDKQATDITVPIKAEKAENIRQNNIQRVKELYDILKIYEKSPHFDNIFMYKAMNLSGIGLKDDDFGIVRTGKYIQIIAITYEPDASGKKKAKNISLGYFGKGETIDPQLKSDIIEFVLCWRYEKAFQNVEHYKNLLDRVEKQLKEETISL